MFFFGSLQNTICIMRVLKKKIPKNVNMLAKKAQEDITRRCIDDVSRGSISGLKSYYFC